MVSQGEIKRYTLYALGEVVLIVIGILIALQVSDLTDTAKLEEKRLNLIERLERQIEINQFQTKEAIDELRTQLNNAHRIMGYMGKQEPQLDAEAVDSLMPSVTEDHHLGLDLTTLQEALDNGEISILNDEGLRTSLYALLKFNDRLTEREAIANYDNNNFFIPFLYKHANLRNASAGIDEAYRNKIGYSSLKPNDYQALFRNREFENLVGSRFYYAQEMLTNYQRMKSLLSYLSTALQEKEED